MNTDILRKQYYKAGRCLKKNAPTILSGLGAIGVIGTSITAIKATPKALDILSYQEELKMEKDNEHLTTFEKMLLVTPIYIPTILMSIATISCILGANALNKQKQAMLVSAYSYLNSSYNEYKEKVKEIFGEEGEKKVREEIAKDKYIEHTILDSDETKLFFDEYSGRYFEMSLYDLQNAVYNLNRKYALQGDISINAFYELIGLPPTEYGEVLGWCSCKDWEFYGYSWIDIRWEPMEMPDNLECYAIRFDISPEEGYMTWAW